MSDIYLSNEPSSSKTVWILASALIIAFLLCCSGLAAVAVYFIIVQPQPNEPPIMTYSTNPAHERDFYTLKEKGQGQIDGLAFSSDGELLVAGWSSGLVNIWHITDDAKLFHSFKTGAGGASSVAFSPDNEFLATASFDGQLSLWQVGGCLVEPPDETCGNQLDIQKGHDEIIYQVVFSPDGRLLASASKDNKVRLWKIVKKKLVLLRTLTGHGYDVESVAFAPHGGLLASGSSESVRVWNMATCTEAVAGLECGQLLRVLGEPDNSRWTVNFSLDSVTLASASSSGLIEVWQATMCINEILDENCGKMLHEYDHDYLIMGTAFTADNQKLIYGDFFGNIQIWQVGNNELLSNKKMHQETITRITISPDGTTLASGSHDGVIQVQKMPP